MLWLYRGLVFFYNSNKELINLSIFGLYFTILQYVFSQRGDALNFTELN